MQRLSSLLKAFINIANHPMSDLVEFHHGKNRINNIGKALENFIQDIFADTLCVEDTQEKLKKYEKTFSYQGNQNNPPDLILKNSDAIEVKKIQTRTSAIALNSSYPKAKLYASNPMITKACRGL